jgi:DNA invertase Pin-like site-specific DNA recombinase
MNNIIAYYRVSTQRQGQSGLGLDAQQFAVNNYARSNDATIVSEFTEVESGKRNSRPEIAKAIAACKASGATLVVAKLDRLARSVSFTSALMDAGIEFIACDNPNANRLTVHILSAIAESEGIAISTRTREALAAAKARGVKLGGPNPKAVFAKGNAAGVKAAADHAATVFPIAKAKRDAGWTLEQIAHHLTGKGYLTRYNKPWTTTAVLRLLRRAA